MKSLTFLTDLWQKFSAVMTQRLRRPYAEVSHLYRPVCLPYPSRVCLVTILCLTVGFGNAWGTTQRVSAYGNISNGQTYWIGATIGSPATDYYFKANGGIAASNDNLTGQAVTSASSGTVILFKGSNTSWTMQFVNGNYLSLPSSDANGKYKSQTSSATWTFANASSLIQMTINNHRLQRNTNSNSTAFGSYKTNSNQKNVWLEPAYSVIYDANDATGGSIPDTTYYLYNSTVTVSGNSGTLVKTGYTFAGWNTQADGNGTDVTVGSTFSITSNKKLYAKWASAGCSTYTFHYGNDGEAADTWTEECFGDAVSHVRQIADFKIPSSANFYVGNGGAWDASSPGSESKANSVMATWADLYFDASIGDGTRPMVGQATGAVGTIKIIDNSTWNNKKASFIPAGYVLKFNTTEYPFTLVSGNQYRSVIVTYNSTSARYNVSVGIEDEDGGYVSTNNTQEMQHIFLNTGGTDLWSKDGVNTFGLYDITNTKFTCLMQLVPGESYLYEGWVPSNCTQVMFVRLKSSTLEFGTSDANVHNKTGNLSLVANKNIFTMTSWSDGAWWAYEQQGKFRIDDDSTDKNWYVRFVPYYQLKYDANGGLGSMASLPGTPISCEESAASRTVTVGSCTFTAPEGKEFKEWNTKADGNGTTVATGSKVLTSDVTLYAIWKNATYDITKTFTNVANSSLPSTFTYTGSTTTALNSSFTVDETNYILPASITVTMGGSTLTQGTHYTYNSSTGAFTFDVKITGDIVITAVATAKLKSIAITKEPTKQAYLVGQTFNSTGAEVTATMGDGTTKAVTASAVWTPTTALSEGAQTITATYTENGVTKTATTTVNVYAVTLQAKAKKEAGDTPADIEGGSPGNPTLTVATGAINPAADANNYVFWQWEISGATLGSSATTKSNTITNPTGAVTLTAIYHKPITITWLKGGQPYGEGTPTTKIGYNKQWKDLTLPTAPGNSSLGACANQFRGWSNTMAVEWVAEDHNTEPGTLFTSVTGNTTAITDDITFRAVFATASLSTTQFKRITSVSELTDGTKIAIVDANSTKLLKTDLSSTTKTESPTNIITVSSGEYWVLEANNSNWKIKTGTSYLGVATLPANSSGNKNKDISLTTTNSVWKIGVNTSNETYSTNTYYIQNYDNDAGLEYYSTDSKFEAYYISKSNIASTKYYTERLYIPNTVYADYVTVCCAQKDITLASSGSVEGGTFDAGGATSACEGASVTLNASPSNGYVFNGWTITETGSNPTNNITNTVLGGAGHANDNPATMTMPGYAVTVNAAFSAITGITVKIEPTKTTYCAGEYFDPTGLVITATYANSATVDIPYAGNTTKFSFSPGLSTALTTENTSVTITYAEQTVNQDITVNALRTITKTGSGTVDGGTFTVDNASACVGATINIEAENALHYTFSSWTITKTSDGTDVTGSVSIGSASTASTSFTMPDYNVTVTPTFNENAFRTVVFKNNGQNLYSGEGYDATNKWKQKVYVGEAPVTPTKLADGYGTGDACNSTSTLFYGWTHKPWNDVIDDESDIKELSGDEAVYRSTLPAIAAGTTDIEYHAVWAAGTAAPEMPNPTILASWAKVTADGGLTTSPYSATTGTGTLTSNINMSGTGTEFVNINTNISTTPTIVLSGLNMSSATSAVNLSFYTRGSSNSAGTITVTYSTDNGSSYISTGMGSNTATVSDGIVLYNVVTGIPKTATNIKLTHNKSSGSFGIGTFKLYQPISGEWEFTELTSSNTSGWGGSDWDGYYFITSSAGTSALNGHWFLENGCFVTVSPDANGIITANAEETGNAFHIVYTQNSGYSVQGVGGGLYVAYKNNGVNKSESVVYHDAITYNGIVNSTTTLRWNSTKFGFYSSSGSTGTALKLYKILSSYSTFRTTCCTKMAVTKGGSPTPGTVTGGTFTVDKETACEGEKVTLSVTSTTTGYNFDHWQVLQTASPFTDYSSNVSEGVLTMPGVPVTVTAVFAVAHTTTVTLDKQEGTGGTNSVTATVNLDMPAADMPTRSGYEFGGYYAAPNGSGTQYYAANGSSAHVWDDGESATATLYAKWTASGYTVTLNNASATTAGTPSVSVTYGANTNLTSAITCPTKTNQVFGGYYTEESGAGTRLIDQDGNWLPSVASYTDVNRNWLYANNLTLYAKWTAVSYTNYRTTCGPEIEITGGPVYLTSYPGCEVLTTGNITVSSENWQSTVGAPKFLSFQVKNMVTGETYSHTNSTIGNAGNEVRVYNAAGNGGSYADGGYIALPTDGTNPSYDVRIAYTPSASVYNTRDHYIILVKVYDNSGTKKTLTLETVDVYGRTLPEQFVIAAKKDGKWWALPNDLAGTEAAAKAAKAVEIIVDNTTTPTAALFAPENTLYKATGYYSGVTVPNRNRSGVRFTRNGSQYLQVSTVEGTNVMWLSSTGGTDVQDWYLDGGTAFANYTVKLDPRAGTGGYKDKKMGIFGSNFGFYSTPTAYDIYLLPVETVLAEAEVIEWGKHSAIIEADAGSTGFNAATVIGRIGDEATTPITVAETKTSYKGGATKYNYTINFGNTFDFTTEKGNKLYLDWLNGSGTVVATSMVDIPWIIDGTKTMSTVDGQKTHWSSAEVHVLPGAVLTADAETFSGVTIGTLEIYPGATVKVTTGTLDVSDLVLRYGWTRASGKDYNSAQLQIKRGVGGANLTTTRAYADWYIDYDQFYSMSVPWTVTTSNIRYRNTNSAANTTSVMIRYYDGENRAATGQTQIGHNWKNYDPWPEYLEPSKGYAISAKRPTGKAFSILRMPLTIPSSAWTALGEQGYVESTHKDQVSVTGWGKGTAEWYAMGWNFIGNPYMSTFNGDDSGIIGKLELQNGGTIRYATIPDLGFHNYDQVAIADANILPANGFFIQANDAAAQIVTFNADNIVNPTAPARFTTSSESVPDQEAYIRLSYEGGKDQMGLIIGEDYTENYEANADLAKVLGDAGYVKTYMQYGGMDMAYVAINEELAKAWIPVTVILPANGEYTYSLMSSSEVDELEGVYLIDYANDDKVTNLINENYTFTADAGTISNRFAINAIVGERQIPTDIDVVNEGGDLNSDKPFKFLYHEKVYIYHRGVIYDATGKRVKEINK